MAARRERERRRPASGRRYQFGPAETSEPRVDGADAEIEADLAESSATSAALTDELGPGRGRPNARAARTAAPARPTALPFSAYRDEYRYVIGDLQRVGLVVGSLLVVLILLSLVLPR
jgi:hypothetical protein